MKKNRLIEILILVATLFMSVGYASINLVVTNVNGLGNIAVDSTVFINAATPLTNNVTINNFAGTMLNSQVDLTNNGSESITITITNNTTQSFVFDKVLYDTSASLFYDNLNIVFSLSGLNQYDSLAPGQSKTFSITFTYKTGFTPVTPSDRVLNSYINFRFAKTYNVTYNDIDTLNKNYPTVVFDGDDLIVTYYGDVPYDVKVTSGSTVLTLNTDYTYVVDPNNANNKVLTVSNVKNNITIDRYYKITYMLNGGTNNPSNQDKYLAHNTIQVGAPTLSGNLFNGWYLNSGFSGNEITSTANLSGDITLYAQWYPIYTINYTVNGGTNNAGQITQFTTRDSEPILDAYHTRDLRFDGWFQNSGLTVGPVDETGDLGSGNANLYAKWTNTIGTTTYSDTTYRYTATNVSSDSLRNFRNRSYTQNTAYVEISSITLYFTVSSGNKSATLHCQVESNTTNFTTVTGDASLSSGNTSAQTTLTLNPAIQVGKNYTISCPSYSGDNNGKWKVTKFEFMINS